MGLFSKKPPCTICGGKVSWLLPAKIEDEYICDNCFGKIDMDDDKSINLTMDDFQEYLVFYNQNQLLKDKFIISERVDFGLMDTKFIFDYENKLFCMSKNPDKTVFEGKDLKSFTIKEDSTILYQGSAEGIHQYSSNVPDLARALAPEISRILMNRRMAQSLDRLDDGKINNSTSMQYFDIPEPFSTFNVELHFDHPYWTDIKCDMDGPRFDNANPDLNNYIRLYNDSIDEIQKLVDALGKVAFPKAPVQNIGLGGVGMQGGHATIEAPVDAIEEIKKYKSLVEDGIISKEEFEAKKRQLLGI